MKVLHVAAYFFFVLLVSSSLSQELVKIEGQEAKEQHDKRDILGPVLNSGELYVQFDDQDIYTLFKCQACFNYKLVEDSAEDWSYRYTIRSFIELKADGGLCCTANPGTCPVTVGTCNQHGIILFPPQLTQEIINDGKGVRYYGVLDAFNQEGCVPPGLSNDFCGYFDFTHELITEQVTVNLNGTEYVVQAHTLKSTFKISTWPFLDDARGMRFRLSVGTSDAASQAFRMFPDNVPADRTYEDGTFNEVGIETYTRMAKIRFSPTAIINGGTVAKVNVSGPYDHEFDPYARYFDIDIPKFDSAEYVLYEHILLEDLSAAPANMLEPIFCLVAFIAVLASWM